MKNTFNIFISEFSRIILELSNTPVEFEQMSLFEEFAEINLVFNAHKTIWQYQNYMWDLFLMFKEKLEQVKCSQYELQKMLYSLKECEFFYYKLKLEKDKIWQHYHSFLRFDTTVTEYQKRMIMYKLSKFLVIQRHYLKLLKEFLQSQVELGNYTPSSIAEEKTRTGYYLKWNSSKTDLVELIYGLYHSQTVVAKDKELNLQHFQLAVSSFFNVDLNDHTNIAANIYRRKKKQAVFFSKMVVFFNDFVNQH